jgi:hypothetical protein
VVYLYLDRAHFWYERKSQARKRRKAARSIDADGTDANRSLPVVTEEPQH